MNYSAIKNCDIANGEGVRVSLFVSGCNHHCKGCFNKETWDFNHGEVCTSGVMSNIIKLLRPNYIKGLSILGGEPLDPENEESIGILLSFMKEIYNDNEKDVWLYTGYTWEELIDRVFDGDIVLKHILENVDVLVDGRFIEDEKDISLVFRGSRNQRLIACKKSLKESLVSYEEEKYSVLFTYRDEDFKK